MIFSEKNVEYAHCISFLLYSFVLFQRGNIRVLKRLLSLSPIAFQMLIPRRPCKTANLLKASGVEIFVVAVGNYNTEIVEIASPDRKDHVFRFTNTSGFLDVTKLAFKSVALKKYAVQAHHKRLC